MGSKVDVVLVAWNSAADLPSCLASVPEGTRVIVVDNGSADDSLAVSRAAGAEVVELGENTGFPHAVNVGLGEVTAPYTLLLNPDVVLEADTLERCVEVAEADERVGIVGADLRERDGRPVSAAARHDRRARDTLIETFGLPHLHPRLDRQPIWDRSRDMDVDAVQGAFLLIRTDLFRRLGGLDETVFMYLEDIDVCRRVRDAGYSVRFVAGARAMHAGATSTNRADPKGRARAYQHRVDADLEFLRRYRSRRSRNAALAFWALRCLVGIAVSPIRRGKAGLYRDVLRFTLAQRRGRVPASAV